MKRLLGMLAVALVAGLIVAIISTLELNGYLQSLIYAILVGLVVYAVALIMRISKQGENSWIN